MAGKPEQDVDHPEVDVVGKRAHGGILPDSMPPRKTAGAGTRCTIVMPLADARGGAESLLLQLVRHGRDLGFAWRVVFLEDGPMVAECRAAGAPPRRPEPSP